MSAQLYKYEALGLPCDRGTLDAVALAVYADSPCLVIDPLGTGRRWLKHIAVMRRHRAVTVGTGIHLASDAVKVPLAYSNASGSGATHGGVQGAEVGADDAASLVFLAAPFTSIHVRERYASANPSSGADDDDNVSPRRRRRSRSRRSSGGTPNKPLSRIRIAASVAARPSPASRQAADDARAARRRARARVQQLNMAGVFVDTVAKYVIVATVMLVVVVVGGVCWLARLFVPRRS